MGAANAGVVGPSARRRCRGECRRISPRSSRERAAVGVIVIVQVDLDCVVVVLKPRLFVVRRRLLRWKEAYVIDLKSGQSDHHLVLIEDDDVREAVARVSVCVRLDVFLPLAIVAVVV